MTTTTKDSKREAAGVPAASRVPAPGQKYLILGHEETGSCLLVYVTQRGVACVRTAYGDTFVQADQLKGVEQ